MTRRYGAVGSILAVVSIEVAHCRLRWNMAVFVWFVVQMSRDSVFRVGPTHACQPLALLTGVGQLHRLPHIFVIADTFTARKDSATPLEDGASCEGA
jgi:hypothetical protein